MNKRELLTSIRFGERVMSSLLPVKTRAVLPHFDIWRPILPLRSPSLWHFGSLLRFPYFRPI
jgi:hypothetical protein